MRFAPKSTLLLLGLSLASMLCLAQEVPRALPTSSREHLQAREKWQASGRRVPGMNSAALRQKAIRQKLQMRTSRTANSAAAGSWNSLGPVPLPSDASGSGLQDYGWVSGRATSVAIDPNDPTGNTVYAGGAYGGVWKSSNAAQPNAASVTWTALTDSQPTLAIGSIAIQPQLANPDPTQSVVLAGTGETNSSPDSYYGLGILRSADGGQTWTMISQDSAGTHTFAGLGFSQIVFNSANPNIVVAAAASASLGIVEGLENPTAVNRGIYSSTDGGLTWQYASLSDSGVAVTASSATSIAFNAAAGKFYAAVRFHGFYSSPDGINWTRLSSQPGAGLTTAACPAQVSQACPIYRGEIAVVPNRAGTNGLGEMYVWYVDSNDNDQSIWKSLDGGATWIQLNDSGIIHCGDFVGGCGTDQGAYNLALAAVPDGTATDVYAGAVNIYKCVITNAFPTCNGTGNNSFMNLTHVYGCSAIAKVHPDQHAMDFLVANGTSLFYFANDGGIYRALDGFLGLRAGACGQTNQFDSLNATLGPMTQFVSIAQSSTNADIVFGGTQDNGLPATAFAQTGGTWVNVNDGDDGFTAANPTNQNEWFVSTPPDSFSGVNLLSCPNGINCHSSDFQTNQVASSSDLGGDIGPFYLPFILDPANSSNLILGTCRVWSGSSAGANFSLVGPDFETGGTGPCSGTEVNLVRALAVGGPQDSNGNSQVIYAGTDGVGPLISSTPGGGHVWMTSSADGGPASWQDVTGTINPQGFPISSIALDPSDATGQTAYVAIMGFHTPHVWQTTSGGASWIDFTANLPDAPSNSLIVDAGSSGTVYVGTDVGVFASATNSASWTEVGPDQGSAGFLPNVAVTSLQIFNSSGLKRLRAGTYGRGIWEWNLVTAPDFQLTASNNPQTVFTGATATFTGDVVALNGYNSTVNLSCSAGATAAPQNCSPAPASVTPTSAGANFTLTASDVPGDYFFSLHGVGTDAASTTHDLPLTLHIIGFSLSAPSPNSVSLSPGGTSLPISLSVSAQGSFSGPVTLTCAGLPAGATCLFQPSNIAMPTSGNPVAVTLNVITTSTTPIGSSQVAINASMSGGPTQSQTLLLNVGTAPDYAIAIADPALTSHVGQTAAFNGTISAIGGYASMVNFGCGKGAPPTCTVNPASLTPTGSGAAFTVSVSSNVSQSYSFNINATGTDAATIAHSVPVTFSVLPSQSFDFTIGITPGSASTPAGQPVTYSVNVAPTNGSFPGNVTFACSNLPTLTTCAFNPPQVGSGSTSSTVALSVSTTAPVASSVRASLALALLPIAGLLFFGQRKISRRRTLKRIAICLLAASSLSCGGGLQGNGGGGGSGSPGTPPGNYTITVTATCDSINHSAEAALTVTP